MDAPLIWHIEKYLRKTGMRASNFGREAVKDPRLVSDLRQGREPGKRIAERVFDYMEERGPDPVLPRQPRTPPPPRRPLPKPQYINRPARVDAGRALRIALQDILGEGAELLSTRERPWASATFVGARHYWTWALTAKNRQARSISVEATLSAHEFSVRGYIVADAVVTESRLATLDDGRPAIIMTIEILCVETC